MVYPSRWHRSQCHHQIHLLMHVSRAMSCCTFRDYFSFARYLNVPTMYLFLGTWTIYFYSYYFWTFCFSCSIRPIVATVLHFFQCHSQFDPSTVFVQLIYWFTFTELSSHIIIKWCFWSFTVSACGLGLRIILNSMSGSFGIPIFNVNGCSHLYPPYSGILLGWHLHKPFWNSTSIFYFIPLCVVHVVDPIRLACSPST